MCLAGVARSIRALVGALFDELPVRGIPLALNLSTIGKYSVFKVCAEGAWHAPASLFNHGVQEHTIRNEGDQRDGDQKAASGWEREIWLTYHVLPVQRTSLSAYASRVCSGTTSTLLIIVAGTC